MRQLRDTLLEPTAPVRDAIASLESNESKIALVVDGERRLLGTVTDGDIRRGILRGRGLDDPVTSVMNAAPTTASAASDPEDLLVLMRSHGYLHLPLVDDAGRVVAVETLSDLLEPARRDNPVVLMAGGLGTRLRPLTDDRPKPLIHVGPKPILETVLEGFIAAGFHRFHFSVNYRAAMIEQHFQDGSRWGVSIDYLREDVALGTAGPVGLLPERPDQPVIVMNGDLLTKVNYGTLLDYHCAHDATATMCVREYDVQIPYGVVDVHEGRVSGIREKPVLRQFVNAGIYVLEPTALDLIPVGERFDMPQLFGMLLERELPTAAFPVREYWMDIGRMDDLSQAKLDFHERFGE